MKKYGLILAGLIGLFASCSDKGNATDAKGSNSDKWLVSEVSKGSLSSTIRVSAILKPYEVVPVYPRVNGFIKEIYVDRGSIVTKGQTIVQIDAPEIEQQYCAAKSKYLQAWSLFVSSRDNYKRLLTTAKTPGTVAQQDLEQAQARMLSDSALSESEKSNYKAMAYMQGYLTVTAPFDGVVTERNVHPGALVGPNSKNEDKPLLVIEQQNHLRLVMEVPEVYSDQLAENLTVTFHVNALPAQTFKAMVSRKSGALSLKYRAETIEADVYNNDKLLKPGMYAAVVLPIQRPGPCYIVPSKSIVTSTEKKYIVCVRDGKTKWVDIQEGNSRNDTTEVFGDILPGDKYIVNATDGIQDAVLLK